MADWLNEVFIEKSKRQKQLPGWKVEIQRATGDAWAKVGKILPEIVDEFNLRLPEGVPRVDLSGGHGSFQLTKLGDADPSARLTLSSDRTSIEVAVQLLVAVGSDPALRNSRLEAWPTGAGRYVLEISGERQLGVKEALHQLLRDFFIQV